MDEELYYNLARATQYCQIAEEFCNNITEKQEEIQQLKMAFNDSKERKEKPFSILRTISLTVFIIAAIFLGLMLVVALSGVKANSEDIAIIKFLIFVTIFSLLMLIFSKVRLKKIGGIFEKKKCGVVADIEKIENSISEITKESERFAKDNRQWLEYLPAQYRNLQASSYMLMAVKNGRADTLKEAINLYEEQLHRWKLEDAARQSAEAQEYLALAVEELSARQAETNDHLRSIEFMQYMQYLNGRSDD